MTMNMDVDPGTADNYDDYGQPVAQAAPSFLYTPPSPPPPEVAKALSTVMASIKKLYKGETNQYARYNYASADRFFEAVAPLMAAEGLIIIPQQVNWKNEIVQTVAEGPRGQQDGAPKPRMMLTIDWDFYLMHSSGALWQYPWRRTIMTDSGSPQKWGGAQTYVLKQFLRALLLIPTGDDPPDADADRNADADAEQPFRVAPPSQRKRNPVQNNVPASAQEPAHSEQPPPSPDTGTAAGPTNPAEAMEAYLGALVKATTVEEAGEVLHQYRLSWGNRWNPKEITRAIDSHNHMVARLEKYKR